ncbi:hypothetical protein [Actinomadura nitritigenes]|uniref:hypothetical protein n=1 Tax=Actinomadura nitritigenes TaxID=134602 RepID=UPI003D8EC8B4
MKARHLLYALVALVGVAVLATAGTVAYALLSTPGGRLAESNRDPRAVKGSDPRLTFERAAGDLRLRLPASMTQVRYMTRNDSSPYFLHLAFAIPCQAVAKFAADNDLQRVRWKQNVTLEVRNLQTVADDLGRRLPEGPTTNVWTNDEHDPRSRVVADVPLNGQTCQVIGTFANYA